jgi:hypothetical protein
VSDVRRIGHRAHSQGAFINRIEALCTQRGDSTLANEETEAAEFAERDVDGIVKDTADLFAERSDPGAGAGRVREILPVRNLQCRHRSRQNRGPTRRVTRFLVNLDRASGPRQQI